MTIDAMILAAGLGTRMQPLTRVRPKALLPVCGEPLLEWALRDLAACGVQRAVINTHHHADQLRAWCAKREARIGAAPKSVRVLHEPDLLGTAGGLANAAPYLTTDPVLVRNVDLFLPLDVEPLLVIHRRTGARATLVLVRDPELALIRVHEDRIVEIRRRPEPENRDLWCFSGIYLLSQDALAELPRPGFAELTPHLRRWAEQDLLAAHRVDGPFREVGTLETYFAVQRELARDEKIRERLLGPVQVRHLWIEPGARVDARARLDETIVFAETSVAESVTAVRSILGPPDLIDGAMHEVARAGGITKAIALLEPEEESNFVEFARVHEDRWLEEHGTRQLSREGDPIRLRLVHGGGSHRRVLRATCGGSSAIVVSNPPLSAAALAVYPRREGGVTDENETFLYVAELLRSRDVLVPKVFAHDAPRGLLLLEDLGATTLFDALAKASAADAMNLYAAAIDVLLHLQRASVAGELDPARTHNPDYDPPFVRRYEIDYFVREMVEGMAGLSAVPGLESELDSLAKAAGSPTRRCLMHRDFQSRNLMLTRGAVAVVDFQGARLGPRTYDLASLLFDPYVPVLDEIREPLFARYLAGRSKDDASEIRGEWRSVAIVRLLQASGAFAYLGHRQGKSGFLPHAPLALARVAGLARDTFPHLAALTEELAAL